MNLLSTFQSSTLERNKCLQKALQVMLFMMLVHQTAGKWTEMHLKVKVGVNRYIPEMTNLDVKYLYIEKMT